MENLGVETVGETWGWFQIRPLEIYMYIYIFRRRGPILPQSYQFVGQKYSPKKVLLKNDQNIWGGIEI